MSNIYETGNKNRPLEIILNLSKISFGQLERGGKEETAQGKELKTALIEKIINSVEELEVANKIDLEQKTELAKISGLPSLKKQQENNYLWKKFCEKNYTTYYKYLFAPELLKEGIVCMDSRLSFLELDNLVKKDGFISPKKLKILADYLKDSLDFKIENGEIKRSPKIKHLLVLSGKHEEIRQQVDPMESILHNKKFGEKLNYHINPRIRKDESSYELSAKKICLSDQTLEQLNDMLKSPLAKMIDFFRKKYKKNKSN